MLGQDIARGVEGDCAERKDAGGVRGRNDEPKQDSVPGVSTGAYKIGRDDRFAVPRFKSMQGAEADRDQGGGKEKPQAEVLLGDQLGERAARCSLAIDLQAHLHLSGGWRRLRRGFGKRIRCCWRIARDGSVS